ncbi:MAG: radical SAM protein [Candidatus Korarchaeum sp.]|nr:radical SAM protein [Candidatus Korarchaeum sp.]MDW8035133.1 radical SAM protein [Candidatus Korarchaeum sp.]
MISEVFAKSLLNRSSIGDYCVNPYIGCSHACIYCYASYYARRMGYSGEWGNYVHVKVNAVELLRKEVARKSKGVVYISSLTDAYQPIESSYELTRKLLGVLLSRGWPVIVQTKSPLVLRDLDLIKSFPKAEVGFTIITLDESLKGKLEPRAPSISSRIDALGELKRERIATFTFIGPIIPGTPPDDVIELVNEVKDRSDLIYFDKFRRKPGLVGLLGLAQVSESFDTESYYKNLKKVLESSLMGIRYTFLY